NGQQVRGAVQLSDGDLITLGGVRELTVNMRSGPEPLGNGAGARRQMPATPQHLQSQVGSSSRAANQDRKSAARASTPDWLSTPLIAGGAGLLILLIAGLLLLFSQGGGPEKRRGNSQGNLSNRGRVANEGGNLSEANTEQDQQGVATTDRGTPETGGVESSGTQADKLEEVEKYALRLMRGISNDNNPTLKAQYLSEINEKVKSYQGSASLRDNLRAMKQRGVQQLAGPAKSADVKLPLVVFAALAKMDRDNERADPVAVAQRMLPTLSRLRGIFSTELANDSLLIIAAYDQGPGGTTHPLQMTLFSLAQKQPESPATIRTVWYLHEHQKLSPQSYELVLRFLAVGVVAQDPRRFGVDAEALAF
ncbi:MAG TPA: hypothetical protein VGB17_19885, partial [Pyrinomonadaceae bacterium]